MRRPTLRHSLAALALLSVSSLAATPSHAQTSPAPAAGTPTAPAPAADATAPAPSPDTIIAKVGGDTIRYADLQDAMQTLPDQLRQLPPAMLYPMLLDQLVDREVIVLAAKKDKLQDDPKVVRAIQRATEMALQNALLTREIQPMLTPDAIQARYTRDYAGKPGDEEVRAAHILVATEQEAKDIIAKLKGSADFAELAAKSSTDPSAKQNNGELGWFKKGDMLPEFSDAAFGLKVGEITQEPIHTRFGYHVIKLEERRTTPPPGIDEVRDQIRQQIIQEGVAKVLADAKQGVPIERFDLDGTPMPATPPTPGK